MCKMHFFQDSWGFIICQRWRPIEKDTPPCNRLNFPLIFKIKIKLLSSYGNLRVANHIGCVRMYLYIGWFVKMMIKKCFFVIIKSFLEDSSHLCISYFDIAFSPKK